MGRVSVKKDKTLFQLCREELELTREKASELMDGMSPSRIEKIENGQEPSPYDVLQMANAYKRPDLCNYFCSHKCEIGLRYVPQVEVSELPNIILETIASLNDLTPYTNKLIQIARDGKVSDEEIPEFAFISNKLDEISLAVDALNLWIDKTASEHNINLALLKQEKLKARRK